MAWIAASARSLGRESGGGVSEGVLRRGTGNFVGYKYSWYGIWVREVEYRVLLTFYPVLFDEVIT